MTQRETPPSPARILIAVAVSLAFCSVVFVLWLGAHDVLAGRMSGGLLSQFVLFAVLGATSLGELSQVWSEAAAAAGAAGRISELLAVEPLIVAPRTLSPCRRRREGRSPSSRVCFAYDSAPDARVIDDLSFSVAPGRAGRDRRRLRRGQVDRVPAHHALLRLPAGAASLSTGST